MANTIIIYQGDGSTTDFAVPFDYLRKSFVRVFLDRSKELVGGATSDVTSDYYFVDPTTIRLRKIVPTVNQTITIRRYTSGTDRVASFRDGSVLYAKDLDTSQVQAFHIAEEARDIFEDSLNLDVNGRWNAKNQRIVNVGTPIDPKDATTKEYVDKIENDAGIHADSARASAGVAVSAAKVASEKAFEVEKWHKEVKEDRAAVDAAVIDIGDNLKVLSEGSSVPRKLSQRFGDVVNVKDFGAKGDGYLFYDGTIKFYDGANDDTDAIQAAINACSTRGGGKVYLPQGIYMCRHTVDLPSSITLVGDGQLATIIAKKMPNYLDLKAYESYVDFPLIRVAGTTSTLAGHVQHPEIKDMTLSSNLLDGPSQVMSNRQITASGEDPVDAIVSTDRVSYLICERVTFYGRGRHLRCSETWDSKFIACDFQASGCIPQGYPTYNESIKDLANTIFDAPAVDLDFLPPREGATGTSNCNNLYFTNCRFESYVNTAFKTKANESYTAGNNTLFLIGCKFESHGNLYHNVIHNDCASNLRIVSCLIGQDTRNHAYTIWLKNAFGAYIECYLSITKFENRVRDTESICCTSVTGSIFSITCSNSLKVGGGYTDVSIFKQSDLPSFCRMNTIKVSPGGNGFKIFSGTSSGTEYLYDRQELRLHSKGAQNGITLKTDQANLEWNIGKVLSLGSGKSKTRFCASEETESFTPLELYVNTVAPGGDASIYLGNASKRWSQVYAATGTINTSDAREKSSIINPEDTLMRAWGKVNFKVFRFKDAVDKKGINARLHIGVIAQQVIEAFASEGLDATRYGLLCHDAWEDEYEDITVMDQPEVTDEDGNITTPEVSHVEKHLVTSAGDRYGIRYEEALALECAYQRWCLNKLEEKLNKF